jgi:tetratricopeptide (TPR) repeat protein
VIFGLVFFLLGTMVYGQAEPSSVGRSAPLERPWWYTLEQGKLHFRGGAYGDALLAFEEARRNRREQFTRMEEEMIRLLSIPEVRPLGDSLYHVEGYITDRKLAGPAAALAELYYRVPRESLGGSVHRVLEELNHLKNYPDAEYWLGETYRMEGELGIALSQYQKAYDQRSLLETPGFEVEILYKMAELCGIRQKYNEMEKLLNEILTGTVSDGESRDSLWTGDSGSFARSSMFRILDNDGIVRFLTLYRYNNLLVEKAHRLLGYYYYASNRHGPAAEHLMFAFLIQNSILIEEYTRYRYDFSFTGLDNLIEAVKKRPQLSAYINETEYYKTLYYLGSALNGFGKGPRAREFWAFLAGRPEAGEWRIRSQGQLRSPYIDKAQEMP